MVYSYVKVVRVLLLDLLLYTRMQGCPSPYNKQFAIACVIPLLCPLSHPYVSCSNTMSVLCGHVIYFTLREK